VSFGDDLAPYFMLNRVSDILGLTRAMGYEKVTCIVGHDWGGPIAQWCALARRMSSGPSEREHSVRECTHVANRTADGPKMQKPDVDIEKELAALAGHESTTGGIPRVAAPMRICGTGRKECTTCCGRCITSRVRTIRRTGLLP